MSGIRYRSAVVLVTAAVLGSGCTVEQKGRDFNSGDDYKRDLAKLVPLGRVVTDSVNAPQGDNTDWKYIEVREPGLLKIEISVDNPKVEATINFVDALGQPLGRKRVNGADTTYSFEKAVEPGRYFVEITASNFESVYSIGAQFEPEKKEVVEEAPPPPPPPPPPPRTSRKERRPEPSPPKLETREEPSSTGSRIVEGRIINIIPGSSEKSSRVTFDQGANHGIKVGASVQIEGGPTVKVSQVFESASVAIVPVKHTELRNNTRVTFVIPE